MGGINKDSINYISLIKRSTIKQGELKEDTKWCNVTLNMNMNT